MIRTVKQYQELNKKISTQLKEKGREIEILRLVINNLEKENKDLRGQWMFKLHNWLKSFTK